MKKEIIRKEFFKLKVKGHSYSQCRKILIVKYNFDIQLEFLLPPEEARKILLEISEREWAGTPVRDFSIRHSTLENIFLQYYEEEKSTGGKIA